MELRQCVSFTASQYSNNAAAYKLAVGKALITLSCQVFSLLDVTRDNSPSLACFQFALLAL